MRRNIRRLAVLAGLALAVSAAASAAFAGPSADPGVTATSIKIGGTFPLTGPASAYKTIPLAEQAYYAYVNAHGGVNGRKIDFTILDDAYNPAQTVPLTQQLVEQDKVFAIVGSLGTAPNLAVWNYTNAHKVPQVFLATGDSYWGFCVRKSCQGGTKPYTIGWQPDYPGEGRLYGKYIAAKVPNAKIGIVFQNDAFGKNYIAGLVQGLGSKKGDIVDEEGFNATDQTVTQQIIALRSKGADTLFIVATPLQAIASLVTATKIGWHPTTFLANVSNIRPFLLAAAQAGASLDGVISSAYVPSQYTQPNLPGSKLGKAIIGQYAPALSSDWELGDSNLMYGLGVAWTFVYALQHAGKNPTRASLMQALHSMDTTKNPFVYPGITIHTSATDNFPMDQLVMTKWSGGAGGAMQPISKVLTSGS
jgi:branched-chain amino acid transport system substrate-binding protein